jgi:hypothetical protein
LACGFSTGFLYTGPNATRWLVTNWHVVTGRRPDAPGTLLGKKPESPSWLRFTVEDPRGLGHQQIELALYDDEGPIWIEADREQGVDLALIRLTDKARFPFPVTQTFARNVSAKLEPGLEVLMIGHPFELGRYASSAIWKSAMIATERDEPMGHPWILVDAPGVPGMSGSPVYLRIGSPQMGSASPGAVGLELFGVYAGAVGDPRLETLRLGRVFPIGLVEKILKHGRRGHNPFPPRGASGFSG